MNGYRILIIEDEYMLAKNIELYLKNNGCSVQIVATEADAIEQLEQNKYDAAIVDITLPDGDGWSIVRHIKKYYPAMVVLITSARRSEDDKVFGFELGADDYLTKPISLKELYARLLARLQAAELILESTQPHFFQPDLEKALVINTKSHIVTENGKEIHFKPKEFELVVFLNEHPDQVFTRDDLLGAVWGYDFDGDERTVDSHIKKIRAKSAYLKEHLTTIWGVGYRLNSKGADDNA
ncbi:response regulator transcription factor [Culicoidibacter larvae]|uniref:Response regulator transcription factor n=1 Tax=Culicoidibacter larvae TaxID=2579976 RepID=A0A5R8QDD0_9FIRM|nr:response regulator transcription factor [Culicoidibacter larvae]TLG74290.1 response regulator transcription factor [Culicoidibacter larvae]